MGGTQIDDELVMRSQQQAHKSEYNPKIAL